MDQDDFHFPDAAGSETSDVVTAHDVDHAGTHGSRESRHRDRRETETRQDHVTHHIPDAFGDVAHAHDRQEIHFNGKLEDQHKSQPEDRHGHADERDDHDNVIEDRILL